MSEVRRIEIRVTGRVQGVWFRESTREQAERIGALGGWVRNVPDGTVEIVAEGPQQACEQLIGWCSRGPRLARVDQVRHAWGEPTGEFESFQVVHWR